ncbi:PREDICTED: PIN2/TERF1-interacting telomerase inhibitor 1 [Nanorana parkeri]|uniref:PIN2/TERF1-interacting telomerase inhibitor 1 n=1 Tax=Nanorana parkeri TaxID=125878 RepID=UPI000854C96A|nr:PREDICTED: PIN2/TERF1-interacting telomerase inhibitor 1 [Nanorana parkeri]
MAMLAEPRRKQKWSIDPRNSTWSKDETKFGQKMLEKMGWSKGKGLGAQEQGCTEHVKVQVKNNTMGLGASIHHEDNWIAHQDDFNQLLAELNDCHGTASSGEIHSPANDSKKSFSLEEKSKSSKKRVHYMKFAKGKDLSCRSDTDLACIFGKREKRKKSGQDEADAESEESEEKEPDVPSPKNEVELGNTVTSSLSVTKKKSKKKKRSRGDGENDSDAAGGTAHERRKPKGNKDGGEVVESTEEPEHAQEEKLKRKKRKKETLDRIEINDDSPLQNEEPKKKKKKKKQQKSDN